MSDVGYFALKATYYHRVKDTGKSDKYVKKILEKNVKQLLGPSDNEVLYGRAGYLSALAYVRLFQPTVGDDQITDTLEDIIFNGIREGKIINGKVILNWTWHKKVLLTSFHPSNEI